VGAVVENHQLQSVGGQIIRVLPSSGFCLSCSGLCDAQLARIEFLDGREYDRQLNMGYVRGADVPEPQVYSLNMAVASFAVWWLQREASGERSGFDGIAIDAADYRAYTWLEKKESANGCPICGKNGIVFDGDKVELLTREVVPPATPMAPADTREPMGDKTGGSD